MLITTRPGAAGKVEVAWLARSKATGWTLPIRPPSPRDPGPSRQVKPGEVHGEPGDQQAQGVDSRTWGYSKTMKNAITSTMRLTIGSRARRNRLGLTGVG